MLIVPESTFPYYLSVMHYIQNVALGHNMYTQIQVTNSSLSAR